MLQRRLPHILIASLPLLVTILLYGYALRLPYFLDDGPHFQILGQTDGWQHWGDFDPFPFYRPVTFTVWKLFETITGTYPAFALHVLNVFAFGLCGVLVGQLARIMAPHDLRGLIAPVAGIAFVLFPFSYQAVAMVAALFHLTLALGLLLCIWAALRYLRDGRRGWLLLCYGAAIFGVFSHENGLILAALLPLALVVVYRRWRLKWRRVLVVIFPVWGIVAVYLMLWLQFSPNDEARSFTADLPAALASLLQGLIYPFAALVRPLFDGDAEPLALILGVVIVVLLALTVAIWRTGHKPLPAMLYGLAWYVAAILPAALFLDAGYVLGQTRLALLASAGGAIFWGMVIVSWWRFKWLRVPAILVMVLAVYVSVEYLDQRRAMFLDLAEWNAQLVDLVNADDAESNGLVLVNAPGNLVPVDANRRFLIGTEGVLWTDPTLDYRQQLWMNGGGDPRNVTVVVHAATLRAEGVRYGAHGPALDGDPLYDLLRGDRPIYATIFDGDSFDLMRVNGVASGVTLAPVDVEFPDIDIQLEAASWTADGRDVTLNTQWLADSGAPVTLFAHVYCDDQFIAQSDGYAWADTYPFRDWLDGKSVVDVRRIRLDEAASPDCLRVFVGLYYEADGVRLQLESGGERLPDDQFPVPRR